MGDSSLGSLAQSARSKNLKNARWILIIIGVLTIIVNGLMLMNVEHEAEDAIKAETKRLGPGMVVDQEKAREFKETVIRFGYLIYGGTAALGVVFVLLGLVVNAIPVPATVLGLVLYLGANIALFALNSDDPAILARGAILKIITVVALIRAVQSAIAYQREKTQMEMLQS
jgi:hypothetical protein